MSSIARFVRRTRVTLLCSLLVIAVLAVAEMELSERSVEDQQTAGTEINLAGRQRMLTQRIGLLASQATDVIDLERRAEILGQLTEAADELQRTHDDLRFGNPDRGLDGELSAEARAVLTSEPYRVDDQLEQLLAATGRLINAQPHTQSRPLGEIQQLTADDGPTSLLAGLNEFVLVLDRESVAASQAMRNTTRAVLVTLLGVLALIWLVAFRPTLARLRTTLKELETSEAAYARLAYTDELTGLPNRRHLEGDVADLERQEIGVIVIDLDGFKEVNDTLGHAAGDELLIELAERFEAGRRDGEIIARTGGDEFAVITIESQTERVAERAAQLISLISQPAMIAGTLAVVGGSAGVHVGAAETLDDLLSAADTAMYCAKSKGRGRVVCFEASMRDVQVHDFELSSELGRALDQDEFFNVYQPILDLESGKMLSVETLLRWRHPQLGVLAPGRFLPLLRRDDSLLHAVTIGVLRRSLLDTARFRDVHPDLTVAVNLPGRLVTDDFLFYIERLLRDAGLPGSALTIEITEHELIQAEAGPVLDSLHELGVQVAVDDFGTGYCSLARLHTLAVDYLKLDRQFVQDLDGRAGAISRAVASIASELELTVVAEGIETPEQADAMRDLGFERGQGFLWSPGVEAAELVDQLVERSPTGRVAAA